MEKKFIATGKTFEIAVQTALTELGLTEDQVTVQLLERAKAGLFGIGSRPCKIEVTYEVPDPKPATALSSASRSKPKKTEPVKTEAPKAEPPQPAQKAPTPKVPAPKTPTPKTPEPKAPATEPKQETAKPERKEAPAPKAKAERKAKEPREPKAPRVQKEQSEPQPAKEPKVYAPAPEGSVEQAIEAFLTGLMKHMGSDAVPHAVKTGENSYQVELVGKDLGMLIGRRGDTLDAIQHLTNYAVNRTVEGHIRVNVDAEDYRVKREESLRRYARKKAQQVLRVRRRTILEPMNAYERHVIHAALQDMENITTYSTGTEPNRRVIIEYVR